jgi:Neurobeachin/BDCP, DUF4704 alpha solenoid region
MPSYCQHSSAVCVATGRPLREALANVGGMPAVLFLLGYLRETTARRLGVRLLRVLLRYSHRNVCDMLACDGYSLLARLMRRGGWALTPALLDELLRLCGVRKDSGTQLYSLGELSNVTAFRTVLLDWRLWIQAPLLVQHTLLCTLRALCARPEFVHFNRFQMEDLDLLGSLLHVVRSMGTRTFHPSLGRPFGEVVAAIIPHGGAGLVQEAQRILRFLVSTFDLSPPSGDPSTPHHTPLASVTPTTSSSSSTTSSTSSTSATTAATTRVASSSSSGGASAQPPAAPSTSASTSSTSTSFERVCPSDEERLSDDEDDEYNDEYRGAMITELAELSYSPRVSPSAHSPRSSARARSRSLLPALHSGRRADTDTHRASAPTAPLAAAQRVADRHTVAVPAASAITSPTSRPFARPTRRRQRSGTSFPIPIRSHSVGTAATAPTAECASETSPVVALSAAAATAAGGSVGSPRRARGLSMMVRSSTPGGGATSSLPKVRVADDTSQRARVSSALPSMMAALRSEEADTTVSVHDRLLHLLTRRIGNAGPALSAAFFEHCCPIKLLLSLLQSPSLSTRVAVLRMVHLFVRSSHQMRAQFQRLNGFVVLATVLGAHELSEELLGILFCMLLGKPVGWYLRSVRRSPSSSTAGSIKKAFLGKMDGVTSLSCPRAMLTILQLLHSAHLSASLRYYSLKTMHDVFLQSDEAKQSLIEVGMVRRLCELLPPLYECQLQQTYGDAK